VQVVADGDRAIFYAEHTAEGTAPASPGTARWVVEWTAPAAADVVRFHVAANAANGDASEFGDFIYLREVETPAVPR